MILGSRLKELLHKNDLTISELSRGTGVPIQTIHNWLIGTSPQNLKQLKKVADFLGLTIDELCFKQEKKEGIKTSRKVEKIYEYEDEINAGIFEVVLRKIK